MSLQIIVFLYYTSEHLSCQPNQHNILCRFSTNAQKDTIFCPQAPTSHNNSKNFFLNSHFKHRFVIYSHKDCDTNHYRFEKAKSRPEKIKLLESVFFNNHLINHPTQHTKAMLSKSLHRFVRCVFSGLWFCCLAYVPFCL